MGRKTIQGLAKNLCQIFLGWQSYQDLPAVERMGKGQYEIDILTTLCKKDGVEIGSLDIARKLQEWFSTRLRVENISLEEIKRAILIIDVIYIQERRYWLRLKRYKMSNFMFKCFCHIEAFGRKYTAQDKGQRELV